jgi:hypothetical protein
MAPPPGRLYAKVPAREHGSPPDGRLRKEGRGILVRRKEVRLRLQGQEQDLRSRQGREVSPPRHLGQGDPHARQRRIRPRQVHQEPAASGHGQVRVMMYPSRILKPYLFGLLFKKIHNSFKKKKKKNSSIYIFFILFLYLPILFNKIVWHSDITQLTGNKSRIIQPKIQNLNVGTLLLKIKHIKITKNENQNGLSGANYCS